MEGHILSALAQGDGETLTIANANLPILALLISGGHTELVLMKEWLQYKLIGQTRDDAVGEAFDKVARMLSLPYPGGPEISKLAEAHRADPDRSRLAEQARAAGDQTAGFGSGNTPFALHLPRPMIDSGTCDFSFAGLKTAVLYLLKDKPAVSDSEKQHIAHEFENAVAEVLWKKTAMALEMTGTKTLVIGGGVSANTHIRREFTRKVTREFPSVSLRIPAAALTTDNAIMIALAGFYRASRKEFVTDIKANGNQSLA
jgi:N6-L-threonylcarbamoyladenine synthase